MFQEGKLLVLVSKKKGLKTGIQDPGLGNHTGHGIIYQEGRSLTGFTSSVATEYPPGAKHLGHQSSLKLQSGCYKVSLRANGKAVKKYKAYLKLAITINRLGLQSNENILWSHFFKI